MSKMESKVHKHRKFSFHFVKSHYLSQSEVIEKYPILFSKHSTIFRHQNFYESYSNLSVITFLLFFQQNEVIRKVKSNLYIRNISVVSLLFQNFEEVKSTILCTTRTELPSERKRSLLPLRNRLIKFVAGVTFEQLISYFC